MRSQTQFPQIRQLIGVSAVVSPLLFFSAFLIFARVSGIWFLIPLIPAIFCLHAFPPFIPETPSRNSPDSDAHLRSVRGLRRLGEFLVLVWFIETPIPELRAFVERVQATHALYHWALVSGLGLLSLCAILRGRRRTDLITDQDIYSYYSMIKPTATASNEPASGDR